MAEKGEEKSKDDDSVGDQPMEEIKADDGKEEDLVSSPATNLNEEGGSSATQGYVDPKMYNKFKNDGSFLAQVLALQKKKKVRKLKEAEGTDGKKKKKSRKTSSQQGDDDEDAEGEHGKKEKDAEANEEDEEDEREVAIKNEYIEKINKMKEEGFFTDKGIGAGMVK
ncbi:hypothetical protein PCYB_103230 [Plasmodium cynomolgi strain B]|uniref:Uncharacterized protein n=1 Tax=Plasmodium cynomolgi (strain B) TaxID=1120755 RepID=K6UKM6_PLACD|nr:hypothetical protein PCYB_103230 [Plasmodium cynomolgi strain B]GAB66973.1 hypothetical protein PCYB_103230 [Plasmodium cynomolgi strain B]